MRTFIGIDVPGFITDNLQEIQREIKSISNAKLVDPENMHITLKFLGEIQESQVSEIGKELEKIGSEFGSFKVRFKGMGCFPSLKYIRVVWIGIEEGTKEVLGIQSRIDDELKSYGFKKEKKYHPHFTIARIKDFKGKKELVSLIENKKGIEVGEFQVKEINFKKSTLTRKGPVYEDLLNISLG